VTCSGIQYADQVLQAHCGSSEPYRIRTSLVFNDFQLKIAPPLPLPILPFKFIDLARGPRASAKRI
jgi:hypothetical protein